MRPLLRCLLASTALFGIAACAPSLPPLDVETQWSSAILRFGLLPIYPLREDIQIGDVILYAEKNGDPTTPVEQRFTMVRLGNLSGSTVRSELRNQGLRRLSVATVNAGTTASTQPPAARTPPVPARPDVHDVAAKNETVRLRRVAFPLMEVARFTEAQLGGGSAFGGIGASLGLNAQGSTALSVSIGDASELFVDASRAHEVFVAAAPEFLATNLPPDTLLFHIRQVRQDLAEDFCTARFDRLNRAGVSVIGLNSVIFARNINYAFNRDSSFAAKVAADLAQIVKLNGVRIPGAAAAAQGTTEESGATSAESSAGNAAEGPRPRPTADNAARIAAAQASAEAIKRTFNIGSGPGANLAFAVSQSGDLTLVETFPEAMAVGAGSYIRFSIEEVAWSFADISDATPAGHGLRGGRTMRDARDRVAETCAMLNVTRGWKASEADLGRLAALIAHKPKEARAQQSSTPPLRPSAPLRGLPVGPTTLR